MGLFNLFGGGDGSTKETHTGLLWGKFERRTERWHFGPRDDRTIVYDGRKGDTVYRFVDGTPSKFASGYYQPDMRVDAEPVIFLEDEEQPRYMEALDTEQMYAVTEGKYHPPDTPGTVWSTSSAIMVVDEDTFATLRDKADWVKSRSMSTSPKHLDRKV